VLEHAIAMVAMLTERDPFLRGGGNTQGDGDDYTESYQRESGASHKQDATALQDHERKEQHGKQQCSLISNNLLSTVRTQQLAQIRNHIVMRC
jgi:hypothetical protein